MRASAEISRPRGAASIPRPLRDLHWSLLPSSCLLCGLPAPNGLDLCDVCRGDLPSVDRPCLGCALPLPEASVVALCGRCQRHPHRFDRLHARCLYQDPADLLVQALKFSAQPAAARIMATLMLERPPREFHGAVLLPVPLHWWRRWRRGFDQAELLARQLARGAGLPLLCGAATRSRATAAQSGLGRVARRRNLADAFTIRAATLPPHLILIDDVATSGATLDALAAACRRAGAERVDAWVFARTPPPRSGSARPGG